MEPGLILFIVLILAVTVAGLVGRRREVVRNRRARSMANHPAGRGLPN